MEVIPNNPNQNRQLSYQELIDRKKELLFIYNEAEQTIHHEGGTPLDYLAINEAEQQLHGVQAELDRRGITDD